MTHATSRIRRKIVGSLKQLSRAPSQKRRGSGSPIPPPGRTRGFDRMGVESEGTPMPIPIAVTIHQVNPPVCPPVVMPMLSRLLPAALAGQRTAIEELYAAQTYKPVATISVDANDATVAAIAVYEMTTVSDELPGWVLHQPTGSHNYCPILLGMVLTAGSVAFAISTDGLVRIPMRSIPAEVAPA